MSSDGVDRGATTDALAETAAQHPELAAVERVLHYKLIEPLGAGAMGAVYKATDERLGRLVAIKRVFCEKADADARRRLVLEARAASTLSHPSIVTIYAIEETAGDTFLVMEYVEGLTLAALLERSRLDAGRVAAIGADVADALACAHARGLVHRDIKPANLMITPRGAAKVLDFGLVKSTSVPAVTEPNVVVGTVPYMSPEQLRGAPVDGRSDLFALGAVLYEAATGRRPFPADNLGALVHEILAVDPTPPRALAPELPEALDAVILRALAKDPSARFADAAEMAAALRGVGLAGSAPRPSPVTRAVASVAVLPFLDLSPTRDQDYLCDGIAEEILTALTCVPGLRVAGRSSAFQFKPQGIDARAAGARLGVDAVLEGAVRRASDRLRVTVQLVDVQGGYQRWSRRFDGDAADVFAIQDEIAAAVAGALGEREASVGRTLPTSPEAYEHFLRGRRQLRDNDERAVERAKRSLTRAIELDPSYAPAHAALAMAHALSAEWHGGGADAARAASVASLKAIELVPDLAEAHVARAAVLALRKDHDGAIKEFEDAERLNPRSFDVLYRFARLCFQIGRDERAVDLFRRAAEICGEDYQSVILSTAPLRRLGRTAEMTTALRDGVSRVERALEIDPGDTRALTLGACAWADLGERDQALEWAARAVALAPDDSGVRYNSACVSAKVGDADAALDQLEQNVARGVRVSSEWLSRDPDWDPLRGHPRFLAILRALTP